MKCMCTYEQGDSDCPEHVVCSECGADISFQAVVRDRKRLLTENEQLKALYGTSLDERARLDAELEKLRARVKQLEWVEDCGGNAADPGSLCGGCERCLMMVGQPKDAAEVFINGVDQTAWSERKAGA
jgi:hypothetical protein